MIMALIVEFPSAEKHLRQTVAQTIRNALDDEGVAPETAQKILDLVLLIYDKNDKPVRLQCAITAPPEVPASFKAGMQLMEQKLSAFVELAVSMIRLCSREFAAKS
jgi:hypothetical protein